MNKELNTFDLWWMMQSKIPYRDKTEIARSAWYQARITALNGIQKEIQDEFEFQAKNEVIALIDNMKNKDE